VIFKKGRQLSATFTSGCASLDKAYAENGIGA
jgi:hypothetical protein